MPAEPPAAMPEGEAARAKKEIAAVIERAFAEHFRGSPLTHHTDLWNLVFKFKEELKARLGRN